MKFTQIEIIAANNSSHANNMLREWTKKYPGRRIININVSPNDYGYFLTIVYEIEV